MNFRTKSFLKNLLVLTSFVLATFFVDGAAYTVRKVLVTHAVDRSKTASEQFVKRLCEPGGFETPITAPEREIVENTNRLSWNISWAAIGAKFLLAVVASVMLVVINKSNSMSFSGTETVERREDGFG